MKYNLSEEGRVLRSEQMSKKMRRLWKSKRSFMLRVVTENISSAPRSATMTSQWRRSRRKMLAAARRNGIVATRALRRRYKTDQKFAEKQIRNLEKIRGVKVSKAQRNLKLRLLWNGFNLKLEFPVDRFSIDIADPKRKLGIEVDGAYWHKPRSDRRRDKALRRLGWKILRVPTPISEKHFQRCLGFLR